MESLTTFTDTSSSPSPSSLVDIPLNDDYFFREEVVTDFSDLLTTSFLPDNLSHVEIEPLNLGPVRDPLHIVIPITILYSLLFFTGLVGNVVTCIVIARNKHMHTATNYYLFSLAVSDLLLLVTGLPQEMHSIWSRYPYVFGEVFCVVRGLAAETSANATVLTITAFTVERYVAICHPFLSHTMSKLSRAVKLILGIWIVALVFAIPQAIQFGILRGNTPEKVMCTVKTVIIAHSFEISTFLFFVLPMTLITVLYSLIGFRLRRSNMMKKDAGSFSCKHSCSPLTSTASQRHPVSGTQRKSNCCRHHQSQSSRRVLKMLVAVVVAFFICWAPFHAQRLFAIYGTSQKAPVMLKIYEIMTYISGILYYVSTTINPILYHIMSLKFREAFKDTLSRCCRFQGHRAQRSYSILSRSAQRGAMGASNAGQESTDYSGNSVREEVLPSGPGSCGSSVNFRKQDTGGYLISGRGQDSGWVSSPIDQNSADIYKRSFSVVISTTQCNENDVKTTMVHQLNRQNMKASQVPVLGKSPAKGDLNIKRGGEKENKMSFWSVFRSITSSPSSVEESKKLSVSYSPTPTTPNQAKEFSVPPEMFGMIPVCSVRSLASSSNNVSNSSLRDVDRGALEDELTAYMQELRRREEC